MNVTELIQFLQELKDKYGDVYIETVDKSFDEPRTFAMLFNDVDDRYPIHTIKYIGDNEVATISIEVVRDED